MDLRALYHAGLSEEELLELRAKVKAQASDGGKRTSSFQTTTLSGTLIYDGNSDEWFKAIRFALQMLDPEAYGRDLITNRTRAEFY
jgi:hypothetical protein